MTETFSAKGLALTAGVALGALAIGAVLTLLGARVLRTGFRSLAGEYLCITNLRLCLTADESVENPVGGPVAPDP